MSNRGYQGNNNYKKPYGDKPKTLAEEYPKLTNQNILNFENLGNDLSDVIDQISKFVKNKLKKDVITPTQIRNIYNRIVKIEGNVTKLQLLRPKLAFVAGKFGSDTNKKAVIDFFMDIIKDVNNPSQVKNFKMFMEAVVAYHKYHHGEKDKN